MNQLLYMVMSLFVIGIWIVTLYLTQRITNPLYSTKKMIKIIITDLKWKILDYMMVFTLMLWYLDTHFINILIWIKVMNNITPLMNGKMSTSNNSSISTFTSKNIISTNDKVCSLQSPIHEKIKYSELSKSQETYVGCASNEMKKHIKSLAERTRDSVKLEYFLKDHLWKKLYQKLI